MKRLSVERIKQIHHLMIEETGGMNGIRDEGLLESAVNAPFQTFDDVPMYKTIEAKVARLALDYMQNDDVEDNAIPDVKTTDDAQAIYAFYRAGILAGPELFTQIVYKCYNMGDNFEKKHIVK